MLSGQEPRRKAANDQEKYHGQRDRAYGTRNTSARDTSGVQPMNTYYQRYHWHREDAGNRPPRQLYSDRGPGPSRCHNGGVEQKERRQTDSRGEQSRASRPDYSAGPSRGRKKDGSVETLHANEPDSGVGPRHGTGRAPGAAPWPENTPSARQPTWAVPGKDWLLLLPNAVEPMELGPAEEAEEAMEVDPAPPDQTWNCPGTASLSTIGQHKQWRRSARPAPYSSRRLHPKH